MNDIFKHMQAKVGCEYISDLPSYKRKVWQEMYSQPTFACISLKISLISSLQSEILVRKKQSILRLTALCVWI